MPTQTATKNRRDTVLKALHQAPATSKDLKVLTSYLFNLEAKGFIKKAGQKNNGRGRPANVYKLTDKGRKRASYLLKKV